MALGSARIQTNSDPRLSSVDAPRRPMLNALARTVFRRRPTAPQCYAALVCIAGDNIEVFRKLLCAVLNEARQRNLDHLLIGLDAAILAPGGEQGRTLPTTRIYSVEWRMSVLTLNHLTSVRLRRYRHALNRKLKLDFAEK